MNTRHLTLLCLAGLVAGGAHAASTGLDLATAERLATTARASCAALGKDIAVAVVDASGQTLLQSRSASVGPHNLEAARRLGLDATECIYVGDDERDILAGRAAGMPTVAARYGYLGPAADVSAWNADAIIDSPEGLLKLLDMA